jgi:hypothetical protein
MINANKKLYAGTYADCFVKAYPELPAAQSKILIEKAMLAALKDIYAVDINGKAFKATSKALGIKHTYKAIKEFLENDIALHGLRVGCYGQ